MTFFKWSDKYLVHIPEIDADHRNLFALANRIHEHIEKGAGQGAILQAIGHLVDYVHSHFEREERLMERVDYPDIVAHKKTHRMLEQIVHSMQRVYLREPEAIDPDKLLEFLRDWLRNHIVNSDMQYEPWVKRRLKTGTDDLVWEEPAGEAATTTINIAIQPDKAWIVQECARLLREDDWRAEVIEEAATRSAEESLEHDKTMANVVLR